MWSYRRSVSPNGQITLPTEIRRRLRLKARDKVTIEFEGDVVTIRPAKDSFILSIYRSISALDRQLTVEEMTEIAAEEHAQLAAQDGL